MPSSGMTLADHQHERMVSFRYLTLVKLLHDLVTNNASSIGVRVEPGPLQWPIFGVRGARRSTRLQYILRTTLGLIEKCSILTI